MLGGGPSNFNSSPPSSVSAGRGRSAFSQNDASLTSSVRSESSAANVAFPLRRNSAKLAALVRALRAWAVHAPAVVLGSLLLLVSALRLARARGARALLRGWAPRGAGAAAAVAAREAAFGRRRVVEANGLRFSILEAGDAAKPLLLCLHGFPESAYSWRWWLRAFAADYHVVAVDQRGYGGSSAPRGLTSRAYRAAALAADALALVRALGHGGSRVTLAAHDWGGMVAWIVARELEARGELARLVIVNIPHPARFFANLGVAQALRSLYIVAFQVPWLPEWLLSRDDGRPLEGMFLGSAMGVARRDGPTALTRADVAVFKHHLSQPGALTAALNWYRQIFDCSLDDFNAAPTPSAPLQAPTLVLWGTRDAALGEELLRGTDRVVSDLRVHRLEGCSHWAQQDHVAECVDAVARFLGVMPAPLGAAPA